MASLPKVDVQFGTKLMTHLGLRLSQLEAPQEVPTAITTPLTVTCSTPQSSSSLYSPVSSGYASDSDYSRSSPAPAQPQGLLQQVTSAAVWRPW